MIRLLLLPLLLLLLLPLRGGGAGVYVKNLVANPTEDKFRSINLENAAFQARVGALPAAMQFLAA